jgi:hypothetical protein
MLITVLLAMILAPINKDFANILSGNLESYGIGFLAIASIGFFIGLVLDMVQISFGDRLIAFIFKFHIGRLFSSFHDEYSARRTEICKVLNRLTPFGELTENESDDPIDQLSILRIAADYAGENTPSGVTLTPSTRWLDRAQFFGIMAFSTFLVFMLSVVTWVYYAIAPVATDSRQILVFFLAIVLFSLSFRSAKAEYISFVRKTWQRLSAYRDREEERREVGRMEREWRRDELAMRAAEVDAEKRQADLKDVELRFREQELNLRREAVGLQREQLQIQKKAAELREKEEKEPERKAKAEKGPPSAIAEEPVVSQVEIPSLRPNLDVRVTLMRHWLFWQKAVVTVRNVGPGIARNLHIDVYYHASESNYRTFSYEITAMGPGDYVSRETGNTKDHGVCFGVRVNVRFEDTSGQQYTEESRL